MVRGHGGMASRYASTATRQVPTLSDWPSVSGRLANPVRWLHQVFENTCDTTPNATALECDGRTLTYRQLDERANRLAQVLRARGIGLGCRVAILLQRSVWTYVALLGVGKAGAAFVPIDPGSPPDRVAYIAEDADVDLVVTST